MRHVTLLLLPALGAFGARALGPRLTALRAGTSSLASLASLARWGIPASRSFASGRAELRIRSKHAPICCGSAEKRTAHPKKVDGGASGSEALHREVTERSGRRRGVLTLSGDDDGLVRRLVDDLQRQCPAPENRRRPRTPGDRATDAGADQFE